MDLSRKRDRLADVRNSRDPGHRALESEPEARVDERAVLPEIEVPPVGVGIETLLAQQYDRPLFVFNYPKGVKAFYMKENPDDPRTVLNNDCLAPEGYGEIIGGSQREDDYYKLLARIHRQGLDSEAYRWYLDLRKYGTFVHSGFGLGLERTVAWISGIPHIREAIAVPRQIHRLYP